MTQQMLFLTILIIVISGYLLDLFLGYLNTTTWSNQLPVSLKGIYDEGKYSKQQQFERERYRYKLVTGAFSFGLLIMMLSLNGFAILDQFIRSYISFPLLQSLVFFGILGLLSDLLSTPFDVYNTFIIEQKYGFNTTTVKTYILDKLKSWLIALFLGGGILALIIWIYLMTNSWFWIIAWGVISVFSIFISYFYTIIILPLFNKLIPLADGELREAINLFAEKVGFPVTDIYIMDGSKRSNRGNAYFSGFGKQKKIVLFDTLVSEHPVSELVAILAHEIGHYKKKHILKGLIISVAHTGALLFILSYFIGNPTLSKALGATIPSFHMGLVAFGILYSPLSSLLGLGMNVLSRKNEYEADQYAAQYFDATILQKALIKLSVKNLSNLTPHPAYVFFNYSHPTLLQRLKALDKFKQNKGV